MEICGPFLDKQRRASKKHWYLSYFIPKLGPNGAPLQVEGKTQLVRKRPYCESKGKAEADIARLRDQYASAGAGTFVHSREAQSECQAARALLPAGDSVAAAP